MRYESRFRPPAEADSRYTTRDPEFSVTTEPDGKGFILELYGELDVASAPLLEKQIKRLQWGGASRIVLDLSGLDFVDSSGLHVLIRAHRRCLDGQLTLLRGSRRVHRVFELTRTDTLLPFAD